MEMYQVWGRHQTQRLVSDVQPMRIMDSLELHGPEEEGRWSKEFLGDCCRVKTFQEETRASESESSKEDKTSNPVGCPTEGRALGGGTLEVTTRRRSKANETRKRRQRKRQEEKSQKWEERARRSGRKKITPVRTWNIHKAKVSFQRKNRFAAILKTIAKSAAEIVLLSELDEKESGIKWIKAQDLFGVLIHGNKSGVFLRDECALKWKEQGYKRTCGRRTTLVEVDKIRFGATYQPIWKQVPKEFARYREELSMTLMAKGAGTLILGGDFNAQVGNKGRETDPVAGKYGIGPMNGQDLIEWCHANELCCLNSFFNHGSRGTRRNPAKGTWH